MPDDPRNDSGQSDFDDWLSEESAPPTDPYAALADSTDPEDIDEWQSFAEGAGDSVEESQQEPNSKDETPPELEQVDATAEIVTTDPVESDADSAFDEPDPQDAVIVQEAIVVDQDSDSPVVEWETDDTAIQPDEVLPFADHDTGELEIVVPVELEDDAEATGESGNDAEVGDMAQADGPLVDFEAFDGGDEPDTAELEIIVPAESAVEVSATEETIEVRDDEPEGPDGSSSDDWFRPDDADAAAADATDPDGLVPFDFVGDKGDSEFDPFEDTGEAVFVAGGAAAAAGTGPAATAFGDLWEGDEDDATADVGSPVGEGASPEDFALDEDAMMHGATREHTGLAAAIAAAESEDTAQVALVAEIPGLETSVVGFEDVVEAEGHRKVRARASGDLIARVVTGLVLILALAASLVWRPALVLLAVTVFVLGSGEFYTALVRSGRKPISLFGFMGIIGASLGAYFWSAAAIPIAFVLATVLLLLFYAVVPGKSDPMGNLALTTTVMVWAGLGSFALLIARSDDYQTLIIGVVVAVAATDIAAFFVGRSIGRTHFAPWVSPNKTVEGLVAGTIVAIAVGAGLNYFDPFELTSGLAIGAAAAVFTPLGDLAMSAAKRSLGLKDMGSVLPGHGGFLDRIDGLLFTIPAAWAILVWAGLL